jgi:tetratricopeptide (TPR) repeat protein
MSELRVESFRTLAGHLGAASPLPPLRAFKGVHGGIKTDDNVPESARTHLGYGLDAGLLPYAVQDGYDRRREEQDLRVAVLENETLRAMFLLELGGRLWSLVHKPSGRELLYRNPVFQPANLAVRNAWFAGGVEWNCSIQGHTPFTCSPLFAARARTADGAPILRLYEWERIRGVPYQLDFWLPDGSPWLFARGRIVNPHAAEIPMYWWSNIAVHEAENVRVIVPTDAAYNFGYTGVMKRIPVPVHEGVDRTYSTNAPGAADAFYDIPEGRRPWVSALDGSGRGLIQTSTRRLRGRKLFVWGMGAGGRHWQEYLAQPGSAYIEIQAGLAQTQLECIPMPSKTEWTWLEAYGLMEADADAVHGDDWQAARGDVQGRLDEALPEARLNTMLAESDAVANQAPEEILQRGSGWGALERRRAEAAGQPVDWGTGIVFDDGSMGDAQAPWLVLLQTGEMPCHPPGEGPGAWLVQAEWHDLLAASLAAGHSDHWLAWLHLGVMRYSAGEVEGAEEAWRTSVEREPSAWALRNLAVSAQHRGDNKAAADLLAQACELEPGLVPLAIECCNALMALDRPGDVAALIDDAPPEVRDHPRMQVARAHAELKLGLLDNVERFLLSETEVPDIREGEVSLSDLWFQLHEQRVAAEEGMAIDDALKARVREQFPPPRHIDFRMAE